MSADVEAACPRTGAAAHEPHICPGIRAEAGGLDVERHAVWNDTHAYYYPDEQTFWIGAGHACNWCRRARLAGAER